MRKYKNILIITILSLGILLPFSVQADEIDQFCDRMFAQNDSDADSNFQFFRGPGPGRDFDKMKMRHRKFDQMRKKKLFEFLKLTDEQKEKFIPEMEEVRSSRQKTIQEKIYLTDSLAHELKKSNSNETKVTDFTERIRILDNKQFEIKNNFLNEVSGFLDPIQVGKLIVFEQRFEMRAVEELFDLKRGKKRGMGMKRQRQFNSQNNSN